MLSLAIVQNTDLDWNLQANTSTEAAYDLLSTDTYSAKLWRGDRSPMLFAPTVTWVSASTVNMAISDTQSGSLNQGTTYTVNVYRTQGSLFQCIGIVTMTCLPAPSA